MMKDQTQVWSQAVLRQFWYSAIAVKDRYLTSPIMPEQSQVSPVSGTHINTAPENGTLPVAP